MIRLIATDLDGTLLDAEGKMPAGIFETIEKLHAYLHKQTGKK